MEASEKLELIDGAIQKIIAGEDNRSKEAIASAINAGGENEKNRERLLTKLLFEVEQLKADAKLKQIGGSVTEKEEAGDSGEDKSNELGEREGEVEVGAEEIVKELRKLRRQNVITHCLLSVMIVLTVAWQLSEVSLILKLKDVLSHPFRSFGSMLIGLVKGPATTAPDGEMNRTSSSNQQRQAETPLSSPLETAGASAHGFALDKW